MQRSAQASVPAARTDDTLMQFLYRAPLGMIRLSPDGTIDFINPAAASLLAPSESAGGVKNLFETLSEAGPQLRALASAFSPASGTVCESIRVALVGRAHSGAAQILFISLFKLDASRFLATLSDSMVDPDRQARAARRSGLESELHQAIADKQLFVQYQPMLNLRHQGAALEVPDRTAGVEALVRWNHRIRGPVSPLEFIGVAEECGLIGALSDLVLGTACRQFVHWQKQLGARAPRRMAVNLSRGQLAQPAFVDMVREILQLNGMAPGQLQLEVHEGMAAQDEAVQLRLHDLKELGVMLALDNFGTGQSSLASLHRLPVDVIKIDRSFTAKAVESAHHRVLIDATVRVAKSLQIKTAAEGIETEAQLAVVRQLGCEGGQGFFFSEAVSSANMVQWLTTG